MWPIILCRQGNKLNQKTSDQNDEMRSQSGLASICEPRLVADEAWFSFIEFQFSREEIFHIKRGIDLPVTPGWRMSRLSAGQIPNISRKILPSPTNDLFVPVTR